MIVRSPERAGRTIGTPLNIDITFDADGVADCAPEVAESLRGLPGYTIGEAPSEAPAPEAPPPAPAEIGPPALAPKSVNIPDKYEEMLKFARELGYRSHLPRPRAEDVRAWLVAYNDAEPEGQ